MLQSSCAICSSAIPAERAANDDNFAVCVNCDSILHESVDFRESSIKSENNNFQCLVCYKTFKLKSSLYLHSKIHSEVNEHKCGTCGQQFVQKQHLQRHIKIHVGDCSSICNLCEKAFATDLQLEQHMLFHKEENNEKCFNQPFGVVTYDMKDNCFKAAQFIHKSERRINMLPWALRFGETKVRALLKPKLGDKCVTVLESCLQLRTETNLNTGCIIKAAKTNDFLLPCVSLFIAHSALYSQHLTDRRTVPLSRFRVIGGQPKDIAAQIIAQVTHDKVLGLRVHPKEINLVRKIWPYLWQRWERIVLWSYNTESFNYFPAIRTRKLLFKQEINKLIEICSTNNSVVINTKLRVSLIINYIMQCAASEAKQKNLKLKAFFEKVNSDAVNKNTLEIVASLFGMSTLKKIDPAVHEETEIIVNFLDSPTRLETYMSSTRTKSFELRGRRHVVKESSSDKVLKVLHGVVRIGLVRIVQKRAKEYTLVPTIPRCLKEIYACLYSNDEDACFESIEQMIINENLVESVIKFIGECNKKQIRFGLITTKVFAKRKVTRPGSKKLEFSKQIERTKIVLKSIVCSVCDKQFLSSLSLNRHKKFHSGEMNFSCVFCQRCFTRRDKLVEHLFTHTMEKPFSCTICEQSFRDARILNKHQNTHTKVKPFECKTCQKRYTRKADLMFHFRSKHITI